MKNKFLTLLLVSMLFLVSTLSAHSGEDYYGHHSMMGNFSSGMWIFSWIFGILILVILVLIIILLIKQIQKK